MRAILGHRRILFGVIALLLVAFESVLLWGEQSLFSIPTRPAATASTPNQDLMIQNLTLLLDIKEEKLSLMKKELELANSHLKRQDTELNELKTQENRQPNMMGNDHLLSRLKSKEAALNASNSYLKSTRVQLNSTRVALKTRTAALKQQNTELGRLKGTNQRLQQELHNSYSNYYLHTPKTGGYSLIAMLNDDRLELSVVKPARVCNHGVQPIEDSKDWGQCWLHATESIFTTDFVRRFMVVRDPFHHVASMYYHCTEAKVHESRAKHMPTTMEAWLRAWAEWQVHGGKRPLQFHCYDPIDLQSQVSGFRQHDPAKYLSTLYDVVGLTSELAKTACLISISIHREVPQRCNCTVPKAQRKFRTTDHGVKHHGASTNLTDTARDLISNLTRKDARLYQAAERAFWEKVETVENMYSVKLC